MYFLTVCSLHWYAIDLFAIGLHTSDVNKDLGLKAKDSDPKDKANHLSHKAKDLSHKAKTKVKDLGLKGLKAKD